MHSSYFKQISEKASIPKMVKESLNSLSHRLIRKINKQCGLTVRPVARSHISLPFSALISIVLSPLHIWKSNPSAKIPSSASTIGWSSWICSGSVRSHDASGERSQRRHNASARAETAFWTMGKCVPREDLIQRGWHSSE